MAATTAAPYNKVACQDRVLISHWINGTMAKVPKEPAAVTMPKEAALFFAGTTRATAPRRTT